MRSNHIDVVENGAVVKVFLLEGAFPFNANEDILNSAGSFWESYALTHAALGFVVEESQAKHVLEFYALDYVGSFLPDVPPPPPTPAPSTLSPTFAPTSLGTPSPTTSSGNGTATAAPTPAPTAAANGTTLVPTPAPTVVGNWTTDPPTPVVTPSPSFGSNLTDSYDGADYRDFGRDLLARGVESAPARAGESSVEGGRFGGVGDSEGGRGGQNWVSGASGSRIVGNGTSEVTWSNDANMRPALGFDENRWIAANYVGKITGLLFNDLQGWSTAYLADHPVYQPLSACGGSNDRNGNGDFLSKGSANSYDFVWAAFERLASNGVIFEQEVVLPPKRTVMCLFPEGGVEATDFVTADGDAEIEEYFRETGQCVRSLAAAAAAGNATYPGGGCSASTPSSGVNGYASEGGVSVLLGLGGCMEGQKNAYLYHNSSHYMRLPLPGGGVNGTMMAAEPATAEQEDRSTMLPLAVAKSPGVDRATISGSTARLVRYSPAMPPRPPSPPGGPDRAYIVYIAAALAAVGLAIAGLRALYRRKQENLAYGRYGGSGGGVGQGSLYSSSAGAGWRSGGGAASDFGDFDIVGGGYEGALFPADNYSSGSLSGSRSQGVGSGGRLGGWRGSGMGSGGGGGGSSGKVPSDSGGTMEAENVELKRPLLNQTAPSPLIPDARRTATSRPAPSSRASRGSGGGGGGGSGSGGGAGRDRRMSAARAELSPPPFSRILGTMGGGPQPKAEPSRSHRGGGRRRSEDRDQGRGRPGKEEGQEPDQGPFGEGAGDDNDDPFSGGGVSGGAGARSLKRDDQPEGDEVFC